MENSLRSADVLPEIGFQSKEIKNDHYKAYLTTDIFLPFLRFPLPLLRLKRKQKIGNPISENGRSFADIRQAKNTIGFKKQH